MHTRALCWEALSKAGSPQAEEARRRAADYVAKLTSHIRDPAFHDTFRKRRMVADILTRAPGPSAPRPQLSWKFGPDGRLQLAVKA
ncbi:MAG: hypothetical protein QM756_21035 [Polyangiaceae bacterium]